MRRLISVLFLILTLAICSSCNDSGQASSFSIVYIDVGQGDAALVECDGHYMLVDGGEGDKVYNVLVDKGVQKLDILAISHLHKDHIGGLIKALTYASKIGITISNSSESDTDVFKEFEEQLVIDKSKIKVPHVGDKYSLGSAEVEVVDVASTNPNDSLVLLVTYKDTRFLFTGDIEYEGQKRIADKYQNDEDKEFKIDVMKMPHHGSYEGSLYRFIRTFMPDYAIISCGDKKRYGHPDDRTLDLLNNEAYNAKVFITNSEGDITVKSDGKNVSVISSKN
ncbi:ComEC/Rec2 family competence protein [Butyrivibrio sp. VCD2006]|uniref:ComEC/Rec2 family competence protein n=1 Tax=Butyrivibrio sp. VCD2006 TaxID=1280664 RepID=UPI0004070624|nr:MBL fold metallo-hydrolase [Butyrivibrio sp. VCD2006]